MAASAGIINQARSAQDPSVMSAAADTPAATDNSSTAAPAPASVPAPLPSATPAATAASAAPAPIPTPAPAVATSADINSAYTSLFGRPAEAAGTDFWLKAANANGWTADQVAQQIAKGAQNEDVNAEKALAGQGSLDKNWTQAGLSTNNLNTSVHWDPTTNQWVNVPTTPTVATYQPTLLSDPTKWNITPEQTTAGQLQQILDPNSPIIRQAMTQGLELANDRGLLNSSIAQGAAQNAAYSVAVPIATADAGVNAKAAGYNADESNQFAVQNANYSNTASQFNAGQTNDMTKAQLAAATAKYQADTSATTQKYLSDQSAATQIAVSKMSTQSQQLISQLHDQNSVLLQNNSAAQAAYNGYINAVANIDIQPSMDEAAKRNAIATQTQIFNAAIAGLKANTPGTPDVSSPLDVSSAVNQAGGVDVSSMLNFNQ